MHSLAATRCRHSQYGAVIVTAALVLLFLFGFRGIALDFSRLSMTNPELQTAMDSCALAAAQELDLQPTAIDRAINAGKTAGNLNRVNLQSAYWNSKGRLVDIDITFKGSAYLSTTDPKLAQYAQCLHVRSGIRMWLLEAMGTFSGHTADYANKQSILAVATRTLTCPLPVACKPIPDSPAPNYGLVVGQWVTLLASQNSAADGQIAWANLNSANNASETEAEMDEHCGTKVGDTLGTPGVETSSQQSAYDEAPGTAPTHVIDYACMLMLQPLSIPMTDTQLEFRGNANAPASPCAASGLTGQAALVTSALINKPTRSDS